MHGDQFPAAEKILTEIENVFKRDKDLKDFEILPVAVGENKSPVLHAEHTLGLQEWCVRHLYVHVYHKLMKLKQQQRLRREDPNIVSRLLLGGVLLNPDCTFLWNIRRELLVLGRFNLFSDLHINAVTLSRRPKSSEAFVYRRWLLSRIIETQLDGATESSVLEEELRVTSMAADRYANNYHAWNHRMWIMSHLSQAQNRCINEWTSSEEWISKHVSEHSGLQYREYLFKHFMLNVGHTHFCPKLRSSLENFFLPLKSSDLYSLALKETTALKQVYLLVIDLLEQKDFCSSCPIKCESNPYILHIGFLAYELLLVTELICLYPGHEALWCHRRFVLFSFYSVVEEINHCEVSKSDITDGVPHPKAQKLSVSETEFESNFLWSVVLRHEDSLLKKCSSHTPEESYQSRLASRHSEWLEKMLKRSGRVNQNTGKA